MIETRQTTITQYRCLLLNLADMHGGVDKSIPVAVFDDIEKLKSYYNSQLAPAPYIDEASEDNYGKKHSWQKVFKKGSALEWYNPLDPMNGSGDKFEVVHFQDAGFGAVTDYWIGQVPSQEGFKVPFNPV